ncbi:TetR/AcrR family transcriptional regulator C-terminal domain-containing protein [Catenulispora yoronensis]
MDHALALLVPTGLSPLACLEAFALVSGFVASHIGYEAAQESALGDAEQARRFAEANARYLTKAVESGAYPHFAAAAAASGTGPPPDPDATFERLLGRVLNGLTAPADPRPPAPGSSATG